MALTFHFVPILNAGRLALSERPKIKEISQLAPPVCHRVISILSKTDQPQGIGKEAERLGLHWRWLKINQPSAITNSEKRDFKETVRQTHEAILAGQNVLVHCSAGLHRTGMFAYALLRKGGYTHEQALAIIQQTRPETFEALEETYLEIARGLF